jgi:uncharacterized protein (TIGR03437 family)
MRLMISMIVTALAAITPGVGHASAGTGSMTVVNSASYQAGPVPRGALLTIYTTERVTPEEYWGYNPWAPQTNHGLWVEASCMNQNNFRRLPILYNGWDRRGSGNQINVYYPNSIGKEPFGRCANSGTSTIRVHPADGGAAVTGEVLMLPAHPGIFMANGGDESPDGDHLIGSTRTPLSSCRKLLETNANACPVRGGTVASVVEVRLTGAEWFTCDPCSTNDLVFELATKADAPESLWVRQELQSLAAIGIGAERARIKVRTDTAPGKYYLRVRNSFRSEFPAPLRVDFGQPV